MKHSTVFAAALQDLWERAYQLKQEKRRPDYLRSGGRLQTGKRLSDGSRYPIIPQSGNGKTTLACFMRRRSDRFLNESRSLRPAFRP